MARFPGRLAFITSLAMVAVLFVVFAVSVLDDGSERRRTTLEHLSEADLDRIVVQLQDPRFDRLSPSVVDGRRGAVVAADDLPPNLREPLVFLRSDDGDNSIWDGEWLAVATGVGVLAVLSVLWRAARVWKARRS